MALDQISPGANYSSERMGWDDTDLTRSVVDRFERVVRQYPHRCAVKTPEQQLTYDELNQAANRLARAILTAQGTNNEPVAIVMDQDARMIVALLAVLKAGKIYVPLDPSNSPERLQSFLQDCETRCIITTDARKLQRAKGTDIINIDDLSSTLRRDNLGLGLTPDTLASIIYTSGSTNLPKGVLEDHKYILRIIRAYSEDANISPDDRLILLFSLTSNGSLGNLFGALLNGATLHCLDPKRHMARLGAWLRHEKITIYYSSASLFRQFAEACQYGEMFPSVRLVQLSAEPVLPGDVELARRLFPPECIFINRLGTTEVGPFLQYRFELGNRFSGEVLPAGFPIYGMRVYLIDDEGRDVAVGAIGQMVVQSPYVARGYWQKPELTATKFLPDPTGGDHRLYLTGDLGRMTADGCFFHLGRKDFDVKIRGYRVNTGDVETTMLAHSAVKQAAVLSQMRNDEETRLVAYYVPAHDTILTRAQLRGHLRKHLPDYMVPSVFVKLDTLPLAPSGKVDRRALASLETVPIEGESSFIAARTPVEQTLATVWMQILGTKQVGIYDNFLELGGHSLNALQIIGRVRAIFNVEISIRFFIDAEIANVATMSEWIEKALHGDEDQEDQPYQIHHPTKQVL